MAKMAPYMYGRVIWEQVFRGLQSVSECHRRLVASARDEGSIMGLQDHRAALLFQ